MVQNLIYATGDNGVAALVYAPCEAKVKVGDGKTASSTIRVIQRVMSLPFILSVHGDAAAEARQDSKRTHGR